MEATYSDRRLVEPMAEWIRSLGSWRVIAHHTFSWEASLWSARRVYERFMAGALPGVSYFYAIEQNPSRDGHHVHALWDSSQAPRKATWRAWHERYGRNRIEPVRDHADVIRYCSKYVCKERAWWDVKLNGCRRRDRITQGEAALQGRTETVSPEPAGGFLSIGCLEGL